MRSFNLVEEPWILVQRHTGPDEVSLGTLFRDASDIRRIGGEVPTQAFAILRILLAIIHDSHKIHSEDRLDDLREDGLDLVLVDSYLDEWSDRFDLFHPDRPFMQVAGLHTAKGEASGLEKIIADVPNGLPFFTTRTGPSLEHISLAEAARWVVHTQSFDPSGIRSGAVGDPLVKGGKGYPIGPAWAGQLGGIILHGDSLAETLLYNLVATSGQPEDRPIWTKDEPDTALRREAPVPAGIVEVLTWQSRRMRLVTTGECVTGVVLAQGDKLTPQNRYPVEAMSGWRFSEPQTKKNGGRDTYMPRKHEPDRSFWRSLPAVLALDQAGAERQPFRMPGTLESLSQHEDLNRKFHLEAVGISYGPQEATIEEIVTDQLDVHTVLLNRSSGPLRAMLQDAVANTEEAVRALGNLAANLSKAAGDRGDSPGAGARAQAMQQAWSSLDAPARDWIGRLNTATDPKPEHRAWQEHVRELLTSLARSLPVSPAAIRGRTVRTGQKQDYLTADLAHVWFSSALRKALPLAYPTDPKES